MVARTKVVPPVTPKIIQQHARHRHWRLALLFAVFLLIVWFSYDLGRSQAPEWVSDDTGVTRSAGTQQHIDALEQERDALQQQVATLQQRVTSSEQALANAQARIRTLQSAAAAAAAADAADVAEVAAVAGVVQSGGQQTSGADFSLELANVRINPTAEEDRFQISFSVMHAGEPGGRVTGTLWIAVNGFMDRDPVRLSFKRLSADRRSYVKMGFDERQDVVEDITLPAGFLPKNVLIEAKPYGEKFTGTTAKVDWDT